MPAWPWSLHAVIVPRSIVRLQELIAAEKAAAAGPSYAQVGARLAQRSLGALGGQPCAAN